MEEGGFRNVTQRGRGWRRVGLEMLHRGEGGGWLDGEGGDGGWGGGVGGGWLALEALHRGEGGGGGQVGMVGSEGSVTERGSERG